MRENKTQLRDENSYVKKRLKIFELISTRKELLLVLGLTLISSSIQIYFALNTWGMITSDEVNQTIEIAHRIVYGYGYTCPEYLAVNIDFPYLARCRSTIYPLLFVIPLYICKILNLNYWTFTIPLFRVIVGINGSLITPSTYYFIKHYTKGKQNYAFLTAIIVTFSPFIFLMSFRSVMNIALIPWLLFIIASYLKTIGKITDKNTKEEADLISSSKRNIYSREFKLYAKLVSLSVLTGIILYMRIDLILVLGAILIFKFPYRRFKVILSHIMGLTIGFSFGILVDSLYYKVITIAPLNWFLYNIVEGGATIYGTSPFFFYFNLIFELKPVFIIIILTLVLFLALTIRSILQFSKKKEINLEPIKILGGFLFAAILVILAFSFAEHKEFRLVYSGFVFFHFSIGVALAIIIEESIPKLSSATITLVNKVQKKKTPNIIFFNRLYIILITILIFSGALIATIKGTSIISWKEGDEITRSLAYVGQQNDSIGVIVVLRYFQGEMYSYLHKDIPIEYFKDITTYNRVDSLVHHIEYKYDTYNYVILPAYQISETPFLLEILYNSNFILIHSIDATASIFRYNGTL